MYVLLSVILGGFDFLGLNLGLRGTSVVCLLAGFTFRIVVVGFL